MTPDGAVVYWRATTCDAARIKAELESRGLANYAPDATSDVMALKSATDTYCKAIDTGDKNRGKPRKVVEGLKNPKKNGYEVNDLEKGEDANTRSRDFAVCVQDGVVIVKRGWASQPAIQAEYDQHKMVAPAGNVSKSLAMIVDDHLGGMKLGEHGVLFWLPSLYYLERFKEVVIPAFHAAVVGDDKHKFSMLHVRCEDEDTIRTVTDEMVRYAKREAEKLAAELGGVHTKDAIEARTREAGRLRAKIGRYRGMIGDAFAELDGLVGVVEHAAALAMMRSIGV
jgi:hypothetical protein